MIMVMVMVVVVLIVAVVSSSTGRDIEAADDVSRCVSFYKGTAHNYTTHMFF